MSIKVKTQSEVKRLSSFVKDPPYSFFSDPVLSYLFTGKETAPHIAEYIIGIIVGKEKASEVGRVTHVVPQQIHKIPGRRGTRVDIQCMSANGYIVIIEMQFSPDKSLATRNFLEAAHVLTENTPEGIRTSELKASVPIVICIDFVNDIIRMENAECIQPADFTFRKQPVKVASEQVSIYFVQLPRFFETEPDLDSPLDCFLYTACNAHEKHLTMREVVDMTPQLQAHEKKNKGFEMMADRHGKAAADPLLRQEYFRWFIEEFRKQSELDTAIVTAISENDEKWESIIVEKDNALAEKDLQIAELIKQLNQ